jgi:hypothetical protein
VLCHQLHVGSPLLDKSELRNGAKYDPWAGKAHSYVEEHMPRLDKPKNTALVGVCVCVVWVCVVLSPKFHLPVLGL